MRIDDLSSRLCALTQLDIRRKHELCKLWEDRLYANNPNNYIEYLKEKLKLKHDKLLKNIQIILNIKHHPLGELSGRLQALNPMAVLARGYSITRTIPDATVVRNANKVNPGQPIEILLETGNLRATVDTRLFYHGKKTNL